MINVPIWTRTVIVNQDTVEKRFIDPHGRFGGFQGVTLKSAQEGMSIPVLSIGEAEVEIAEGQSIAVGDLVIGNDQGLAIKSADSKGAYVLEVKSNIVYVIVR